MALNPIAFTENVVKNFLRYQYTTYALADDRLAQQMRDLLSLGAARRSPLLRGPYISLSRPFREGCSIEDAINEGLLHPALRQRIPAGVTHLYGHQEEAIRAIAAGRTTLVSTGTGSGKTECFLYPIVSKCLTLRDEGAPPGISAVIVYPMNALAEDQLMRLRSLLAGTGITFGMYVGKTPEYERDVTGIRLPAGASRADYEAKLREVRERGSGETIYPHEEVCSREAMRTHGGQPRILLTNVKQLELLLTRQKDVELFNGARLDFLVFDEAHTFTGALGSETACLIRRLRAFCDRTAEETVCVATSATIVDPEEPDAARRFASRFFGVSPDQIVTVGEDYERETWADDRFVPPAPKEDAVGLLDDCVRAVDLPEPERAHAIEQVYGRLAGRELPSGEWQEVLNEELSHCEIAYQLSEVLAQPRSLSELPPMMESHIGRPITEAEILAWLTLGAAARHEGRPLLRPVVHLFIRGVGGAVVSFPEGDKPLLHLSAEEESTEEDAFVHLPILTCTVCGQHYYAAACKDFEFTGKRPSGGEAVGDSSYWEPLDEAQGGKRVVLVDRIIGADDDESLDDVGRLSNVWMCRHCGALHPKNADRCLHCGQAGEMVLLYAIRQSKDNPGRLTSCLSCGSNGRRLSGLYREPAKPVRAVNVADVHVLAQEMIQHSERPRLLVFCDNRQDAAFQAGWMKDHARRYRLRALMAEALRAGHNTVTNITRYIDEMLDKDESASIALLPEVWSRFRKEKVTGRHEIERYKYLRIQVLREVTASSRQSIGLEPWGRLRVRYHNLSTATPWVRENAKGLGLPAEDLLEGISSILDYLRRKRALYDPESQVFSKYWMDGDPEVQWGYLPQLGNPVATKLRRAANEKPELVVQWLSGRGDTTIRQIAGKWGVPPDSVDEFLADLFSMLKDSKVLTPVKLTGSKGTPLPGVSEVYQVHADHLVLEPGNGVYQCRSCRRRYTRRTPHLRCPSWHCNGTLQWLPEDADNYDLHVLDGDYRMLRPEEHTAMVPAEERERLENLFRGESDAVNALVCTPTLELGVDIGRLDTVLMRNVPPSPANYWQRAGRAGRRHRMAVNVTYCRPTSHDRAYFSEPAKMLSGRVDPPAFNLSNDIMVAKHVHAAMLTRLHQYTRDVRRSEVDRTRIRAVLSECLPATVRDYLFDSNGAVRVAPFDLSPLAVVIDENKEDLLRYVSGIFGQGWPESDANVVLPERLQTYIEQFIQELDAVLDRLRRRLTWAMHEMQRLHRIRESQGVLDSEDEALLRLCTTLVKRLKGTASRSRFEAEGYNDAATFGVLAAEGFLPGYGLEVGSVLATAEIPYWTLGAKRFTLPRPPSVALREYVPGNLIYANGNRFVARVFHRDIDEKREEVPVFEVALQRQAIKEVRAHGNASSLGTEVLPAIAVCDVDLIHQSHISDDEVLRFQLGVGIHGIERGQHDGGVAYSWGTQPVHFLKNDRLRLVNIGASAAISRSEPLIGYPVCTVCGQSRSPLSSKKELERFKEDHAERCGKPVRNVGFYADITADALVLRGVADQAAAYSVLEAIRMAAAEVLDMHVEDLQVLVIGHVDRDDVDGYLWDPMPGGSGLIRQMCERWTDVIHIARNIVSGCPSRCASSCIDCLQTFRNGYYHRFLDRFVADELMSQWGDDIVESHPIPPRQPSSPAQDAGMPANVAEQRLKHLLTAAGFPEGRWGEQLRLGAGMGTTTPDVIYRTQHHDDDSGIAIYLDGLSKGIHGDPRRAAQDREIRDWLRNNGWDVIEIAASDLFDEAKMASHFRRLARYLGDARLSDTLREDHSWFMG
ncbi:DEAD/DEAH box helicase [Coriobacteriia bacterium Es71-Z0120]|uniref:DEAD/DEAH box helicase n=1 Tax=Parvivirga hydrogeniphila TaxID=2939460 RepID=UPI002260FD92|nr:DEAD/DEAH box helicase [Parvivirga hydrogeniphila]MCL4079469.1 DEAD/DEAH box helicase [Parvivirga hydrogeniphila]